MDRAELIVVVAGALMAAMTLGWILRWMFGRLNARDPAASASLAARLADAEAARAFAEERLAAVQGDLAQALGQRDEALRANARSERTHA